MTQRTGKRMAARARHPAVLCWFGGRGTAAPPRPAKTTPGVHRGRILTASVVIIALLTGSLTPPRIGAQLEEEGVDQMARSTVLIVAEVLALTRGIQTGDPEWVPLGSGILVSDDGFIVTNSHVIDMTTLRNDLEDRENAEGVDLEIADTFLIYVVDSPDDDPDAQYRATLALDEPGFDLAVLQITGDEDGRPLRRPVGEDRSPVRLAPMGEIGIRDLVHIFGYPVFGRASFADFGGTTIDVVDGRVRSLERGDGPGNVRLIHIDAIVSGGSSGGAVVDEDGQLVGVMAEARAGAGGGSVAVAIPIDRVRAVLTATGWVEATPIAPTVMPVPAPMLSSTPSLLPGVNGNTFTSPTYGWSVSWNDDWIVNPSPVVAFDGPETLQLVVPNQEALPEALFIERDEYTGTPSECLREMEVAFQSHPSRSNFRPLPERKAVAETYAFSWYLYTYAGPDGMSERAGYLECRTLEPGRAVLQITVLTDQNEQDARVNELVRAIDVP